MADNSALAVRFAMLVLTAQWLTACSTVTQWPDMRAAIQNELNTICHTYQLPGATAAVVFNDGRIISVSSGYANVEMNIPMTEETRMLAASIGKTFVAALLLSLADEGRLSVDALVSDWLGSYPWFDRLPNANVITVRHLMSHQSGLPDHVHMDAFAQAWDRGRARLTPESLIGFILDQPPLFAPGEDFAYSDTGYLLLGLVIEHITGRTYEAEVTSRFLEPLQLHNTGPSNTVHIANLATGYVANASGLNLPRRTTDSNGKMVWDPGIEWTGGGLYSTARDLATWGQALFSGDVISSRSLTAMISAPRIQTDRQDNQYGLGVSIWSESSGERSYGHRGWIPGYVSSLRYFPKFDATVAFQINTDIGIVGEERPIMLEIENRLAETAFSKKQVASTAAAAQDGQGWTAFIPTADR